MRVYEKMKEESLTKVICNCCGKELLVENGIIKEGCFHASAVFGYFSKKDGAVQQFDLCESCYDKMLADFRVPAEEREVEEYI